MKTKIFFYLFALLVIFNFSICGTKYEPHEIRIGFVGSFTGEASDIGIAGRRGAVLAVEEQNKAGGINGYKIKLLVKNDENMPYKGLDSVNEFLEKEVFAVIGFFTHASISRAIDVIEKNRLLVITPFLPMEPRDGKNSSIIRLSSDNRILGEKLAEILADKKIMRAAAAYEEKNGAEFEKQWAYFKSKYESLGGKIVKSRSFSSVPVSGLAALAKDMNSQKPQVMVLFSDGFASALICKELNRLRSKLPVYSPMKLLSQELISYGKEAVKRMTLLTESIPDNEENKNFDSFKEKYRQRFKSEPLMASAYSYDAARVLFEAIKHSREMDSDKIKKTIYKMKNFQGVLGDFSIDSQGNALRHLNQVKMIKGKFESIKN